MLQKNGVLIQINPDFILSDVEKFAQKLSLNLEEIFLWYFEQKGVDNPERFLAQGQSTCGVELPQFPQENSANPDAMQLLGSVAGEDENALKRMSLLKQFLNRKAGGEMLQGLLTGMKGN